MAFNGDTREAFNAILEAARAQGTVIWGFILDGDDMARFSNASDDWSVLTQDTLTALRVFEESDSPSPQPKGEDTKWN